MTAKIKLNAASGGGSVSLKAPSTTTGNAAIELQLPVADGSSNQTLVTNGSGTLSFQAQGYGAFHVRSSQNNGDTAQSVAQTTITKVQFKYELADLDGLFDSSTNYRYTPQVAGWYWINMNVSIDNGGGHSHLMTAYLYKNGAQYATFEGGGGGSGASNYNRYGDNNSISIQSLIELNGSSDYVEGYIYQANAASASRNLDRLSTTMIGYLIRRT